MCVRSPSMPCYPALSTPSNAEREWNTRGKKKKGKWEVERERQLLLSLLTEDGSSSSCLQYPVEPCTLSLTLSLSHSVARFTSESFFFFSRPWQCDGFTPFSCVRTSSPAEQQVTFRFLCTTPMTHRQGNVFSLSWTKVFFILRTVSASYFV